MESIGLSIFIGVISGLFTSLLIYVGYLFLRHVFNPWLENRLYKGVLLSGSWSGGVPSKFARDSQGNPLLYIEMKLEVEQHGYLFKGILSVVSIQFDVNHEEEDRYTNFYKIKGEVKNNFVTIEYSPMSRKRTGLGVFLLEVQDGGNSLCGESVFLAEGKSEIAHVDKVRLTRTDTNSQ